MVSGTWPAEVVFKKSVTRKLCDYASPVQRSVFLLLLMLYLTGSASGSPGVRFECFDDLCVSRFQYCSQTHQRCQYCRKEHCLDLTFTPAQCQPICAELFTTVSPRETTSASYRNTTDVRLPQSHGGVEISRESLLTVTVGLIIVVIFLLIVVLVLAICLCKYIIPVYKTLLRQRVPVRETNPLGENEILLNVVYPDLRPGFSCIVEVFAELNKRTIRGMGYPLDVKRTVYLSQLV